MENDFINDNEIMYDVLSLTKERFLEIYNDYITEKNYDIILDKMWEQLSDIPVNNTGEIIEDNFYIWEKGTSRDDIWYWFDKRVQGGIGKRYFN